MKILYVALACLLVVGFAGPAGAAKGDALPATANTIGGPGTSALAPASTQTVLTGLNAEDVCVTVVNTGKSSGTVRIDLIDSGATSLDVLPGETATLCGKADSVDLACDGEKGCNASWRIDKL